MEYLKLFSKKMYPARKEIWAVYGHGEISKEFLQALPEFHFVGTVQRNDDFARGIHEWTLEEALLLRVKYIVLAEQLISRTDEFERLYEFCRENQVNLVDIYGNDLQHILRHVKALEESAWTQSMAELMACIDEHEIISFDIFDTLIMRKTLKPEDVFELTEERCRKKGIGIDDFRKKRIYAQLNNGLDNPDLDEIYDSFQQLYGISDTEKELLKREELDVEKSVLIPRRDMVRLFRYAVDSGKKVYLISDMYISGKAIEAILEEMGIRGCQGVWVSCDYKQLKLEGLFGTFRETIGGTSYLHIGDHGVHDGICAKEFGLDCRLVKRAADMLYGNDGFKKMPQPENLNDRLLTGLCVSRLFNSPFETARGKRRICVHEAETIGYCFIAPLITVLIIWLLERLEEEKAENILFASRDGYLIMELYRRALKILEKELPQGIYFYTSRKAAVIANADEEAMITMLIDRSLDMDPEEILLERFGLPKAVIRPYHPDEYESVHHYVWAHKDEIFRAAAESKRNYFRYMGKLDLKIGRRYLFYDFVSSGTCQRALQKYVPFMVKGLYCGWNGGEDDAEIQVRALFGSESAFCRRYRFMELFMTSDEPSLKGFDEEGKPVFNEELRSQEEMACVSAIQNAVKEFAEDYLENLYQDGQPVGKEVAEFFYQALFEVILEGEAGAMEHLVLRDDWKNGMIYEDTFKEKQSIVGGS